MNIKHPIQPIAPDEHGVLRFKANAIVRYLLDKGGIDLNHLATVPFSQDDQEQFAQLIGYSLSGFSSLSYVSDATYAAAKGMSTDAALSAKDARIATLESTIDAAREAARSLATTLFRIHEEDLQP